MTNLAHVALQEAVYYALSNDSGVSSAVTAVYDHVPQEAEFPYLFIARIESRDWSTKTTRGAECELTIEAASREGGQRQAANIMQLAHEVLHDGSFAVSGYSLVLTRMLDGAVEQQSDGWTYVARMRMRVLLQMN